FVQQLLFRAADSAVAAVEAAAIVLRRGAECSDGLLEKPLEVRTGLEHVLPGLQRLVEADFPAAQGFQREVGQLLTTKPTELQGGAGNLPGALHFRPERL